jgi:predicted nucleic acid binding AN1-type Zn finger protein
VFFSDKDYSKNGQFCIYCYSLKKKTPKILITLSQRDYTDEDTHEILSFCEQNEKAFLLFDFENHFQKQKEKCNLYVSEECKEILDQLIIKKEKGTILNGELISFPNFFIEFEKQFLLKSQNSKCYECGRKVESHSDLRKCFECYISLSSRNSLASTISWSSSSQISEKKYSFSKGKKNPYNFIEKLRLKEKEVELNCNEKNDQLCSSKKMKKGHDYSFQDKSDIAEYSF